MAIYKGDKRFILFDDHCIGEIQYVVPYKSKKLYSVRVYAKGGYFLEFSADKLDTFKRADSIDKLCNKFIIHNKIETWIRTSWNSTKETISIYQKVLEGFIQSVYGAIWTDKGLIYIASYDKTTGTLVPIDVGNI